MTVNINDPNRYNIRGGIEEIMGSYSITLIKHNNCPLDFVYELRDEDDL